MRLSKEIITFSVCNLPFQICTCFLFLLCYIPDKASRQGETTFIFNNVKSKRKKKVYKNSVKQQNNVQNPSFHKILFSSASSPTQILSDCWDTVGSLKLGSSVNLNEFPFSKIPLSKTKT